MRLRALISTVAAAALASCALIAPAARAAGSLTVSASGSGTVSGNGILCPPACKQRFPRPSPFLFGYGHSEATTYGASTPAQSWPALLAHDIGAILSNAAVIGAVASFPDQQKYAGGYAWVLQTARPGTNPAAQPEPFTATVFYGQNDLNNLGGPANLTPFIEAMYTILYRLDALASFEDNDPTVSAPSIAWTSVPSTGVNSGTTMLEPKLSGVPLTITVPARFQGGTIALGFSSTSSTNPPTGQVTYAVTVDGGAPRYYTINQSMVTPFIGYGGGWNGTVDPIPNLARGAHTLQVSLVSSTGTIESYFDYWEAEANQPQARPIVLPLQFPIPAGGFNVFAGDPYVPSNADIATLNQVIRQVAASVGPNVLPVQLSLGMTPANFTSDLDHPNDAGHALIAKELLTALSSVTLTATPKPGARFAGWSGACTGTGACTIALSRNRSVSARFTP